MSQAHNQAHNQAENLAQALKLLQQEDPRLNELAETILEDLHDYLRGAKGFFVKRMVRMVKNRFQKDKIDDTAFAYIVAKMLKDFDALDELYEIFNATLTGKPREKADQIVQDMQSVLNSKLLQAFTKDHSPQEFIQLFEEKIAEAGLKPKQAAKLAQVLWEEVQHKLGV